MHICLPVWQKITLTSFDLKVVSTLQLGPTLRFSLVRCTPSPNLVTQQTMPCVGGPSDPTKSGYSVLCGRENNRQREFLNSNSKRGERSMQRYRRGWRCWRSWREPHCASRGVIIVIVILQWKPRTSHKATNQDEQHRPVISRTRTSRALLLYHFSEIRSLHGASLGQHKVANNTTITQASVQGKTTKKIPSKLSSIGPKNIISSRL